MISGRGAGRLGGWGAGRQAAKAGVPRRVIGVEDLFGALELALDVRCLPIRHGQLAGWLEQQGKAEAAKRVQAAVCLVIACLMTITTN